MNAGRGYVIRFYDEKNSTSLFYRGQRGSIYSRGTNNWDLKLDQAEVFTSHEDAVKLLIGLKKETNKIYKKGYLYIAKVFYRSKTYGGNKKNLILVATKLTKPDRHDFLNAI